MTRPADHRRRARAAAIAVVAVLAAAGSLTPCSGDDTPEAADTTTTTAAADATTTTAHLPGTTLDCTISGTFSPPEVPPIVWADVPGTVTIEATTGGPPAFYQFADTQLRVTAYSPDGDIPATFVAQHGGATYQSPLDSDTGTEVDEEGKGGTVAVELTTTDGVVAPIDVSFSCSTG